MRYEAAAYFCQVRAAGRAGKANPEFAAAKTQMLQRYIDKLGTWTVGSRVRVIDNTRKQDSFAATVVFIEDGLTGFLVKYDHNGVTRRLAVSDIHHFDLLPQD